MYKRLVSFNTSGVHHALADVVARVGAQPENVAARDALARDEPRAWGI